MRTEREIIEDTILLTPQELAAAILNSVAMIEGNFNLDSLQGSAASAMQDLQFTARKAQRFLIENPL